MNDTIELLKQLSGVTDLIACEYAQEAMSEPDDDELPEDMG